MLGRDCRVVKPCGGTYHSRPDLAEGTRIRRIEEICPAWGIDVSYRRQRGVWVQVTLRDGESQEQLLKRFRSAVQRAGILQDVKRRRYFVSKSEKARLAQRRALRRARRRAARQR